MGLDKIKDKLKDKLEGNSEGKTKRARINKVQQSMIVIVGTTAVIIGASVVLAIHFAKYIDFNRKVIDAKDESIAGYSKAIKSSGACLAPKDKSGIYTAKELQNCNPDTIEAQSVPGSLRYSVLVDMAQNADLESVARDTASICKNEETGMKYTYGELLEFYEKEESIEKKNYWMEAFKICSALRVIPDALPTVNNQEALLASLNQIFLLSDWLPDSLAPSNNMISGSGIEGVNSIPVSLTVEANSDVTITVLENIEKSIRDFSIVSATIEWAGDTSALGNKSETALSLTARANAYYTDQINLVEDVKEIRATNKKGNK